MSHIHRSRLSRIAVIASGAMLLMAGTALAQTVPVFEEAPSMEQLRGIMLPEAHRSASRSIVIQRPDTGMTSASVQRATTQVLPAPRAPVATERLAPSQEIQTAASAPVAPAASAPKPDIDAHAVAFRINFAFNSAVLPESAYSMIDMIAQLMKEAPQVKLRVEGHTDAVGSADYNVGLSERRALAVAEYLAKHGVEPARLVLVGKGMAEPLTNNPYDPTNRRVQFVRVS